MRRACYSSVLLIGLLAALPLPLHAADAPLAFIGSWPAGGIPCGLAIAGDGTLYVADQHNTVGLRAFTQSGVPQGQFNPGGLIESYGIAFLSDHSVLFADYYGRRVLRYAPNGTFLSQFATGGVVSSWLAVDDADHVYVVDDNGNTVRKFTSTGALITEWFVNHPAGIAFAEGKLFVTEMWGGNVQVFSTAGAPLGSFPTGATWAEQLMADGAGLLYLGDAGTGQLKCFSTAGIPMWTLGPAVPGYPLDQPKLFSVARSSDGTLFVGDYNNENVLMFALAPTATARETFGSLKARYR